MVSSKLVQRLVMVLLVIAIPGGELVLLENMQRTAELMLMLL